MKNQVESSFTLLRGPGQEQNPGDSYHFFWATLYVDEIRMADPIVPNMLTLNDITLGHNLLPARLLHPSMEIPCIRR